MMVQFIFLEIHKGLRSPLTYVFFAIVFLFSFAAVTYEDFSIAFDDLLNIDINSPYAIMSVSGVIVSSLGVLIIAAVMSAIALRDIKSNIYPLIFSTPLSKKDYFFGRMLGGMVISIIPFMGIFLAYIIGLQMPWINTDRVGPNDLAAYADAFLFYILPNVIILGTLFYGFTTLLKNSVYTFALAIVLYIVYIIVGGIAIDIDRASLVMLADPFGYTGYRVFAKYWTVFDKNSLNLSIASVLFISRFIWIAFAALCGLYTYYKFSFSVPKTKSVNQVPDLAPKNQPISEHLNLPIVGRNYRFKAFWLQFFNEFRMHSKSILKSIPFMILLVAGVFNLLSGTLSAQSYFGVYSHPVTYIMLAIIKGKYVQPLYLLIMYYAGELVWKTRDSKFQLIYDASPNNMIAGVLAKISTLWILILVWLGMGGLLSILSQALNGHFNFQLSVYFNELIFIQFVYFAELAIVSLFLQVIINNKYLGYFVFLLVASINLIVMGPLGIENNLIRFLGTPSSLYSDFYGFTPYTTSLIWYNAYWAMFTILLVFLTAALWKREGSGNVFARLKESINLNYIRFGLLSTIILMVLIGTYINKQTSAENLVNNTELVNSKKAKYEIQYGKYRFRPQPEIVSAKYFVDLYPEGRNGEISGEFILVNHTPYNIDSIHISSGVFASGRFINFTSLKEINLAGMNKIYDDLELGYQIYKTSNSLAPGDSIILTFKSKFESFFIENEISNIAVNQNGTFFSNFNIAPRIGYDENMELTSTSTRREFGLEERSFLLSLDDPNSTRFSDFDADGAWIETDVTISTSQDQLGITAGTLIENWKENGRNYFLYKSNLPIGNKIPFASARYEVRKETFDSISLEIYYHPDHGYNVETMLESMKMSLSYYTENFGPYPLDHLRIIEFPRFANYASSFPGTIMYSESMGFLAEYDVTKNIDVVFYVVAHEVAHQWWGGQSISAKAKGSSMLTESLAQYSAYSVIKKKFGKEAVKNYLKYEQDTYFSSRGNDTQDESSLIYNEGQQYINYQKGGLVFNTLQEMMGEDSLNIILKKFLNDFRFRSKAPYSTAKGLFDQILKKAPDSIQNFISDSFERITLYDFRIKEAKASKSGVGYAVSLSGSGHKYYDNNRGDLIKMNEWVEIGLYNNSELIEIHKAKFINGKLDEEIKIGSKPTRIVMDPNYHFIDQERVNNSINVE